MAIMTNNPFQICRATTTEKKMPKNHTQIRRFQIVRMFQIITLAAVACALSAVAAKADSQSFNVSLNTSVSTLPGTTQVIFFGLTNGDETPDNTLTLSNFNFGGGSADGSPTYGGSGVSGDLSSSISMTDADFSESFDEQFTVGSSLSFQLTTINVFASGAMAQLLFPDLRSDLQYLLLRRRQRSSAVAESRGRNTLAYNKLLPIRRQCPRTAGSGRDRCQLQRPRTLMRAAARRRRIALTTVHSPSIAASRLLLSPNFTFVGSGRCVFCVLGFLQLSAGHLFCFRSFARLTSATPTSRQLCYIS
jgi:hypothetical protein